MTAPPPARAEDSRDIITPDALSVAPELLGLPLARPWRRATALAVDGVLVAILTNAPGVLLGFAAALVLFRVSGTRSAGGGYVRRSLRLSFRFAGAVILFSIFVSGWGSLTDRVEDRLMASLAGEPRPNQQRPAPPDVDQVQVNGAEGLRTAGVLLSLRQADDEDEARGRAQQAVQSLKNLGLEDEDIREALTGVATGVPERPWLQAAVDRAVKEMEGEAPPAPSADSLILAYAAAVAAPDQSRADALRPEVVRVLARDTLAVVDGQVRELRAESERLEERVEQLQDAQNHESRGWIARARTLLEDDLGVGLGWIGLYFTAFVALWQGRTPGKRLLGIRIVRLNGKPIGWWAAFERFGGYAAGVATGLLGFAQIYWDRNRQAIHDKITETVVIRG